MKKDIHLPLYKINFSCISCGYEYQTNSSSSRNIIITNCSNCVNPNIPISKTKRSEVEKFQQRREKTRLKNN